MPDNISEYEWYLSILVHFNIQLLLVCRFHNTYTWKRKKYFLHFVDLKYILKHFMSKSIINDSLYIHIIYHLYNFYLAKFHILLLRYNIRNVIGIYIPIRWNWISVERFILEKSSSTLLFFLRTIKNDTLYQNLNQKKLVFVKF